MLHGGRHSSLAGGWATRSVAFGFKSFRNVDESERVRKSPPAVELDPREMLLSATLAAFAFLHGDPVALMKRTQHKGVSVPSPNPHPHSS